MRSWSFGLVALFIVVSAACQHGAAPPPTSAGSGGARTSIGNILAAEKAGKIDHDTSLVSQLLAIYAPGRLPANLAGARLKHPIEATGLLAEISARLGKMTPELRGVARPFLLRPTDPASFWNPDGPPPGEGDNPPGHCAQAHIDDAHYPIRYSYCEGMYADLPKLQAMIATVDGIAAYDKESNIMLGHKPLPTPGATPALDVYYLPEGVAPRKYATDTTGAAPAVTIPTDSDMGEAPVAAFIIINDDAAGDQLNLTFVHELFHAFQYSFQSGAHKDWLNEATAQWAEDFLFPQLDPCLGDQTEGMWNMGAATIPPKAADYIDGPLDDFGDEDGSQYQYAACLFPYYLTRIENASPTTVGNFFAARGSVSTTLEAVKKALPDMYKSFKGFALVNWNADVNEATQYKLGSGASFTALHQATTEVMVEKPDTSKDNSSTVTLNVPHSSVEYIRVAVSDVGPSGSTYVPQLDFDLSGIDFKKVSVQAITTVATAGAGDNHTYQDWQGATQEKFCRDQAAQNVKSVLLIVANASVDPNDTYSGQIKLKATSACSPAATGNFTYEASSNIQHGQDPSCVKQRRAFDDGLTGGGNVHQTTVTGSTSYSENVTSQWKLALLDDITNPVTKERTVIFEIDSNTQISLKGGGSYEDKLHTKIVAPDGKLIGEGTKDSQTSFSNTATGKVCNGMPPPAASGGGASWSCPPGFAPAYGQPPGHGGLPGRLTLHIAANGDAKYQIGWSADSVPMQSQCQTSTNETSSGGPSHSSSMSYTPGSGSNPGLMVYTSSDGKGNTVPQKGVPAAFSPNQTQSGVSFWSGTFSGGKSGGDIDATSTINNSECKPPGVMGLSSAPCDFSMGDTCDTCSYKATMHLHIHVDVPQQATSPAPPPAAPPGTDPCTALAQCCASLPTVAQQIAGACNMLAGMKQAPACTNMLTTLRSKNLCP